MTHRQMAARALNAAGVTALLEWWARFARPDRAVILAYHRVGSSALAGPLYGDVVGPSEELFTAQIEFLTTHCHVMALGEYLDRRESGRPLPPRCVVVTIDDGYADCFTVVQPVLKRYGAPATVFLATGYLDSPALFWWDRLAYMVSRCPESTLTIDWPRPMRLDLDGPISREVATLALVAAAKALPHEAVERLLGHLAERTGVFADEELARRNYLVTWDQARTMSADGITFGSHTVTHPILTRLDLDRARWEIRYSKRRLEEELGHPVDTFSYPSGESWAFAPGHRDLLRVERYRCAVTTIDGVNRHATDPFALRRFSMGSSEDPGTLRAALTGALRALARLKNGLAGISRGEA